VQLGEQSPTEPGTGLGLAISKRFVELMGGGIRVSPAPGGGSVFSFEIPVTELPCGPEPAAPVTSRVIGLVEGEPRYRLLIVEDEPESRLLLRKLLEPLDFELREAVTGEEAIGIFEQWRPDLIWMDIRMPVMDGLEATRRIKALDQKGSTRIIAVTAHAFEEERREILAAGCDGFIRKPYDQGEIFEALKQNLSMGFLYEDASAPAAPAQVDAAELAELPDGLRGELEEALRKIDIGAVHRSIEAIRDHSPVLANGLAAEAKTLQFGRLLRVVRATCAET
jgi:CheY-like chemotaxis protein